MMKSKIERDQLYRKLIEVSGPHTKIADNTNRKRDGVDIYGSYHFEDFHYTNAQRNTLVRFDEFEVPADLSNRSVVDIGSNLGSLSFECLRRGATRVTGLEFCVERVECCRQLAEFLDVDDRCEFRPVDLNQYLGFPEREAELRENCGRPDVVFCCAVDAYVDRDRLYEFVAQLAAETCYFETNAKIEVAEFTNIMREAGFESIRLLGTSRSDKGFGRRSYILDKKVLLSERIWQRRWRGYRIGERWLKPLAAKPAWERFGHRYLRPESQFDHRSYRLGDRYVRDFASLELWNKVRRLYSRIEHSEYIQQCDFSVPGRLTSPFYSRNLAETRLSPQERDAIRLQVVELVCELNRAGVAHRDLHCGNLFFDHGQIRLVDLEFLEEDRRNLSECYDLTGQGLESPLKSGRMHVFNTSDKSIMNVIGLAPSDFGLGESVELGDAAAQRRAA